MARVRAWIETLSDSPSCVLRSGWISVQIALVGWGMSLLVLMYYSATLGGLFRGSHPKQEPWIWLLGIVLPTALTLAALMGFQGSLAVVLLRRHRGAPLLGQFALGATAALGFLLGMFANLMGVFS